jgi:undecaprenyl-diphosphatase
MSAAVANAGPAAGVARRTLANLRAWLPLPGRPRRIAAVRLLPAARHLAVGAAIAAICVAVAMLLLDWRARTFVRTLPPLLVDTFNELTDFGKSSWFLYPLAGLILLAALLTRPAMGRTANLVIVALVVRFEFVFLAIALPGLFVTIVKRLVGRLRPNDLGPFVYVPWSWTPAYASMPSGHGTTAVGAAVAIGMVWPKARPLVWAYAIVICVSRIVIQAHYVSDVLAAGFVGALGAVLVRNWFAARRLAFMVERDGSMRAMPGPSWRRLKTVAGRLVGQ